ncbi:cutinase family protein [Candidatus Saccharibacteria bacterium]|nr:cutinase family protein [Candidatus Saccharibacteria bacterium]
MRDKTISTKNNNKIKLRFIILAIAFLAIIPPWQQTQATSCPDLRIVFARGSGGELNNDANYLEFKSALENKLTGNGITYDFIDLDYPAIGVGIDNLGVTLGAFFGSGDTYEFGKSVNSGVEKIKNMVNGTSCPNTKYVIGGYSQGAMVISKSLAELNPNRIIYAATFGDPKIYLPEGEGTNPPACKGEKLSDYRMYVPDCHAHKGLLGAYMPYEPDALIGKVGTWCNKKDIFCSSYLSINDHISYISDNLYEDAAKVIFSKIINKFDIDSHIASAHDTAILIDSTASMSKLINKYKEEAYRLAEETLDSGGRVALFDYRDLADPYPLQERCNFDTCTLEIFQEQLNKIKTSGGGDLNESMLSASFNAMQTLTWKFGATKSIVVLTDSGFLEPDHDGITTSDVIKLSKSIDPVNFYIITEPKNESIYQELANLTDGKVVTDLNELNLLTDYIMERFDSLPRVVEEETSDIFRPTLTINSTSQESADKITISYNTNGQKTLVILNDRILGTTTENTITISELDTSAESNITLIPLSEETKGESVTIPVKTIITSRATTLPKAPNTGKN